MSELLYTEGLSVGYGTKTVVKDIALCAKPGKLLCLIGPNGAGKSTLLKTLIRELSPTGGAVYLDGRALRDYREKELAKVSAAVLTGRPDTELMRCFEVVAAGRYPYTGRLGILTDADRAIVRESMEKVGASALAELDFSEISDGQRQRVWLARALCQQPRLLVLDEPTSFLDLRHKLAFLELLRSLAREREIAVVMSMHELELAQRYSDTLVSLKDGRVDRVGTPEEIFRDGYVESLYGIEAGSYDPLAGTAEAARPVGAPRVFVVGGGGSGIPVYRMLRRKGVPFAAGVLPENDVDVPTARALAAEVFTVPANEIVTGESVERAIACLSQCEKFICTASFGPVNRENERLVMLADAAGKRIAPEELERSNLSI